MKDDQNGFFDVQGFYDEAESMLIEKAPKVKKSKKKFIIVKEVELDD